MSGGQNYVNIASGGQNFVSMNILKLISPYMLIRTYVDASAVCNYYTCIALK